MKSINNTGHIWKIIIIIFIAGTIGLAGLFIHVPSSPAGERISPNRKVVVIKLKNIAFSSAEIHIKRGTTVRWINLDPFPHDVTSGKAITGRRARQVKKVKFPDGIFHAGTFGKDRVFEFTFTRKGRYHYFCSIHPVMQGDIIVE